METDSNSVDLMDFNEYLSYGLDFDFPLFEGSNDHKAEMTKNNPQDISETGGILASFTERPVKQMKTSNVATANNKASPPLYSSSSSQLISFKNSDSSLPTDELDLDKQGTSKKKDCLRKRQPQVALKEHVLAERKRRQKLNERLIALSALVPGIKKADKVTVLEDAIKHLKKIQERMNQLEEERSLNNNRMESVIFVKKSHICIDEDSSSASTASPSLWQDEDLDSQFSSQTLPQIEARVSNNDLLIKIHCEKSQGCVAKILFEVDKHHLDVINSFSLPFGNSTLDITILAKMDENFCGSVKDVVKNIKLAMI